MWLSIILVISFIAIVITITCFVRHKAFAESMAEVPFEFIRGDAITHYTKRPRDRRLLKKIRQSAGEGPFWVYSAISAPVEDTEPTQYEQNVSLQRDCPTDKGTITQILTEEGWISADVDINGAMVVLPTALLYIPGWLFI